MASAGRFKGVHPHAKALVLALEVRDLLIPVGDRRLVGSRRLSGGGGVVVLMFPFFRDPPRLCDPQTNIYHPQLLQTDPLYYIPYSSSSHTYTAPRALPELLG